MKPVKDLKEVQQIEFGMMLYLKDIAEKNDIKIMLGGGTLLGAVRHKGFIPWDDDVDMMLLRSDYEKLIDCIQKDSNSRYKVMTVYNTASYPHPFAKLIDTQTYIDQKNQLEIKGLGVAVDIFPIDAIPRGKYEVKHLFSFVSKKIEEISGLQDLNYHKVSGAFEYWSKMARIKIKAILIDKISSCFPMTSAQYVAAVMGKYGEREIMKKEQMTQYTSLMFEGEAFLAPKGYRIYLTKHYGKDYMKLPPKSTQRAQHQMNVYWK